MLFYTHCSRAGKHAQQSATQPIFIPQSPKVSVSLVSPSFTTTVYNTAVLNTTIFHSRIAKK